MNFILNGICGCPIPICTNCGALFLFLRREHHVSCALQLLLRTSRHGTALEIHEEVLLGITIGFAQAGWVAWRVGCLGLLSCKTSDV